LDPKTFETVIPDLAQYERSVTDAALLPEHAPSIPAARIAWEFFDEIGKCVARTGGAHLSSIAGLASQSPASFSNDGFPVK